MGQRHLAIDVDGAWLVKRKLVTEGRDKRVVERPATFTEHVRDQDVEEFNVMRCAELGQLHTGLTLRVPVRIVRSCLCRVRVDKALWQPVGQAQSFDRAASSGEVTFEHVFGVTTIHPGAVDQRIEAVEKPGRRGHEVSASETTYLGA